MPSKTRGVSVNEILSNPHVPSKLVNVPEWGGAVTVRGMTSRQRDQYEETMLIRDKRGRRDLTLADARARLIQMCVYDEDNRKQLFKTSDIEALGDQPAQVLSKLYDVAAELSGMTHQDIEELVGNSEETRANGSSTSSPDISESRSTN